MPQSEISPVSSAAPAGHPLLPWGRDLAARSLAVLLLVFGLAWLLLLGSTSNTAPMDNLEQLTWVRSLQWGYYKHPPLATWALAPLVALFGLSQGVTYVLGALFTLGSLVIFWHLLRGLRGARYATLALLAALCITFYNGRLYYYNHNVVMLLWVVLAASLLWRLTLRPTPAGWLAMGGVMGLGLLTKYQIVIAGACVALWWLRMGWWRQRVHVLGPVLAVVVAALLFAPHLNWLVTHDWLPMRYAESTSMGAHLSLAQRPLHALRWAADWLLNRSLPAWLVLLPALWCARRGRPVASAAGAERDDRRARDFLLLWGVVPLLLMLALGLGAGVDLQMHWGTAFMLFTVPAVMELLRRGRGAWLQGAHGAAAVRAAWLAFLLVQAVLALQYLVASPVGVRGYKEHHWNHFPAPQLAAAIGPAARQALGGPIDIISGPPDVAQAVAIRLPERPRVLVGGELRYSPWIEPVELTTARVIEVFPARELPAGAQWADAGWAWRPGVSGLSRLTVADWVRMRREPQATDAPARAAESVAPR